jgi:hypothetical protein
MLKHFLRAVFIRGSIFNVLREAPVPPREKQVTHAEINGPHLNAKTAIVNLTSKK